MKTAIIIPARFGSTRFPGKPLAEIAGQTMLSRVVDVAREAAAQFDDVGVFVTTEDQRIANHAKEIGVECIMTGDCATGSDRVLSAAKTLHEKPDFIVNLQGDAPFTPASVIVAILQEAQKYDYSVITPVHRLSWADLDRLRELKKATPFSGTTCIRDAGDGRAVWFSKNIIPAIRQEDRSQDSSPIFQHMGLYGYRFDALEQFCALPQGYYEQLEGLEQLRLLENGIPIFTVKVLASPKTIQAGIDSPEDLKRAEEMLGS